MQCMLAAMNELRQHARKGYELLWPFLVGQCTVYLLYYFDIFYFVAEPEIRKRRVASKNHCLGSDSLSSREI